MVGSSPPMKPKPPPRKPMPKPNPRRWGKRDNKREEHEAQTAILRAYGARPWLRVWRMNVGKGYTLDSIKGALVLLMAGKVSEAIDRLRKAPIVSYGVKGMADVTGVVACGRRLEIEVKSTTGRLRAEQKVWRETCTRFNAIHIVARSVSDVETELDRHLAGCSVCKVASVR